MDGYALHAAQIVEAAVPLAAARPIWTGQPLPPGADTVVPIEQCTVDRSGGRLVLTSHLPTGANVRRAGEEAMAGSAILPAGTSLGGAALGLLASLGIDTVLVHRTPRVAIVVTGDELVPSDQQPAAGQVRDSNGTMLASLVRANGGTSSRRRPVPDDPSLISAAVCEAAGSADLVCTTGGASVGRPDHLAAVLASAGELLAHGLAIRPGRPTTLARLDRTLVVALPGNPFAALVGFHAVVLPALRRLAGHPNPLPPRLSGELTEVVESRPGVDDFIPVRLTSGPRSMLAAPLERRGAAMLSGAALADGLAILGPDVRHAAAGDLTTVELLSRPWI